MLLGWGAAVLGPCEGSGRGLIGFAPFFFFGKAL
jgi:hypothetical protein